MVGKGKHLTPCQFNVRAHTCARIHGLRKVGACLLHAYTPMTPQCSGRQPAPSCSTLANTSVFQQPRPPPLWEPLTQNPSLAHRCLHSLQGWEPTCMQLQHPHCWGGGSAPPAAAVPSGTDRFDTEPISDEQQRRTVDRGVLLYQLKKYRFAEYFHSSAEGGRKDNITTAQERRI